ncbi:unnamed protein product [Fraxinus pennsylvanica]|uniref:Uncharacterized protein n=1 Tax=Fraxinus pennsylvanica TaxID=56036 RepID=A0AAD2DJN1_9LAMI|nr:unnamed protein product [Fraxinus pennsylvanica]
MVVIPIRTTLLKEGWKYLIEGVLIRNNRLSCTIWGEQVDEFSNVLDTENPEPAILLLQMCRAKKFRGEVRICNTYYVTKLCVNTQLAEVQTFRDKLLSAHKSLTQRISQISSSSVYDVSDNSAGGGYDVKSIDQLLDSSEFTVTEEMVMRIYRAKGDIERGLTIEARFTVRGKIEMRIL